MTNARRLWFALLAPPAAFGIEGAFGWWIGARICSAWSVGSVRALIALVTLGMLVIAGVGLLTGLNNYRQASATAEAFADRTVFMAMGGVIVGTSFLVGLIWFGLNAALIDVCGGMR